MYTDQEWDGWSSYLTETQSEAAGDHLFSEVSQLVLLGWYMDD